MMANIATVVAIAGNITLRCPVFTELREDSDENLFYCEYEEWAYGIFAILLILTLLLPISLLIYCVIRSYNQRESGYRRLQRQKSTSSYGSQYYGSHDTSYEILSGRMNQKLSHPAMSHRSNNRQDCGHGNNDGSHSKGLSGTSGSRQLSSSAPQLLSQLSNGICTDVPVASSASSIGKTNAFGIGRQCSFCNDNTEIPGIYCESCARVSVPRGVTAPLRCTSDSCVNTKTMNCPRNPAPEESNVTTDSNLYPSLDGIANEASSLLSLLETFPNSLPAAAPSNEGLGERQKYESYFLQQIELAPVDERNGFFLIRDSMSKNDCKVLMLYYQSEENADGPVNESGIVRYRICPVEDDKVCIEGSRTSFDDVRCLVEFYRSNAMQLPCCLTDMV